MKDIKNILLKSIYGSLTPSEQEELQMWLSETGNRELYERIRKRLMYRDSIQFMAEIDTEKALRRVYRRMRRRSWSIAAATVGIAASLFCAVWFWFDTEETKVPIRTEMAQTIVEEHATLTLASGEVLELGNGPLAHTTQADDIEVKGTDIQVKRAKQSVGYNTLKVPHGENYSVTLPDGTKVWVNALSQLKFPSSFEGMEARVVELTGEGYFEVVSDKAHPFKVKTQNQLITVTGTSFNVSAYTGNPTRTTLCEGNVEVKTASEAVVCLTPGEQLTLTEDGKTTIEQVNTSAAMAWIKGIYYFDNQTLEEVFEVLSRWYDIKDVTYPSAEDQQQRFSGKFRKSDSIETIIEVIKRGSSRDIQYVDGSIEIK